MKKKNKILLGIATIWPLLYIPLFILFMFSFVLLADRGAPPGGGAFPVVILPIFLLHFLTILCTIALSVFYIVNVFRNKRVEKDKQVLWVILIFMFGMIAQPIYWYLYIWQDEPLATAAERPALNNAETYNWADQASSAQREKEYVPPSEPPDWRG
ncbi:MAG TPA: hypothetical protein VGX92_13080 [Pyrinomonadaceae bacterium]|jgi:hypothetical protein|nr:hypothetical protein [Pyrinomonadaceae bacterium]